MNFTDLEWGSFVRYVETHSLSLTQLHNEEFKVGLNKIVEEVEDLLKRCIQQISEEWEKLMSIL